MFRRAARLFGLLLGLLMIALLLGIIVPRPLFGPAHEPGDAYTIHVLGGPIHTDIAVRVTPEVVEQFQALSGAGFEVAYPGADWLVFGWGSHEFYINTPTWPDLAPGPALTALSYDPNSVMHVQRSTAIMADAPNVLTYTLTEAQFSNLLEAIYGSFVVSPGVQPVEAAGYSSHDMFFEAHGGFTALMGCNTWTARVLREAGLKTGFWTPVPASLIWSLELHN